ncbi:MAG: hypothetical protein LQ337_008694 [Flavoplaca oasis]|nr:MAG: hypothetical protein LQ337_008694 [Flavoplaca oasis]
MSELRIHTRLNSRYQVFDASGELPFSLVFGLCRRSPADTDPRPVLLDIAGSILDVPYALAHGLLTIHEYDPKNTEQSICVDLIRLKEITAVEGKYLSLPSPINRTKRWRDAFTVYHSPIDINSPLTSVLEEGKRYRIKMTGTDLGIRRWAYNSRQELGDDHHPPTHESKAVRIVNSKPSAGNATFTVVKSLPWPPRVETTISLCKSLPCLNSTTTDTDLGPSRDTGLEISVTNTGPESIAVQTQGRQSFLVPWGLFQPENDDDDIRVRIIGSKSGRGSLQVINCVTGDVVRGNDGRGKCSLTDSNIDSRPKLESLVVLRPGDPLVTRLDIRALLGGLADGQYMIRLRSRGCRWWDGEIGEEDCEDGRVPKRLGSGLVPPLMLESHDEVGVCVREGQLHQIDSDIGLGTSQNRSLG